MFRKYKKPLKNSYNTLFYLYHSLIHCHKSAKFARYAYYTSNAQLRGFTPAEKSVH